MRVSDDSQSTPSSTPGGVAKRRAVADSGQPFVVTSKSQPSTNADAARTIHFSAPAGQQAGFIGATAKPPADVQSAANSLAHITRHSLARYLRNPWFAVDSALVLAVFMFCFRSTFDTVSFFTSAAFLLGMLSVVGGFGLVHDVVPPDDYVPLARKYGAIPTVGGLAFAASFIRAVYCLFLVGLALAFQRFHDLQLGPLLAGLLGLIVACSFLSTLIVCLPSAIAPRLARLGALLLLTLGVASFYATGLLGGVLFVARITLFPFIAPYRLGVAPNDFLGWLGTVVLAPAAIVALVVLAGQWLTSELATTLSGAAQHSDDAPTASAR